MENKYDLVKKRAYEVLGSEISDKYLNALAQKDNSDSNLIAKMTINAFVNQDKKDKLKNLGLI